MNHLKYYLGKFARRNEKYIFNPWCFIGGLIAISIISYFEHDDSRGLLVWLGFYGILILSMVVCLQFHEEGIKMRETYRYKRAKFCAKITSWLDGCDIFAGVLILAIPCSLTVSSAYVAICKFSLVNDGAILTCTFIPSFIYLAIIGLIAFMAHEEKGWLVEAERYADLEQYAALSHIAMDQARNSATPVTIDSTDTLTIPVSVGYTVNRDTNNVTGETIGGAAYEFMLQTSASVRNNHDQWVLLHELNDRLKRTEQAVGRLNALIDTKADLPKEEPAHKKLPVNNPISGLEINEHT